MSANNALQKGLIATLRNNAALAASIPVYTTVPAVFYYVPQNLDDTQPYVTIHDIEFAPDDTDNTEGFDCTVTVHTWVKEETTAQTGAIQERIYALLRKNDTMPLDDYSVTGIDQEFSNILRDPDRKTRHGVQRFRITFEPAKVNPPCN